jgi:hypothetical protein
MDSSTKEDINHIVEADTEAEAKEKLQKYYENKDDEYYVTHIVNITYCNEIIK